MTPRASFVIPAYNAQAWLALTLESCLRQSSKLWEAIVVNDGSSDGTGELIDFYAQKDERIVPVHLTENVGRSEARNIGNEKARSEIILVLDSDDLATKTRVRDTLDAFEKNKPDLLYGGFLFIDEFNNIMERRMPVPFNREVSLKDKVHYILHSTLAYRKGVTLNVRYSPGEFSRLGIDDWKFIWDCVNKGYKISWIDRVLCSYRQRLSNTESGRDPKEVLKVKEEYLASIQ